nr:hypothetical protein [Tanacetum cinerariifolium]
KSIKRNKQPIVGASSTPQVMAIQGGGVQKYKPQSKAKGKGKGKGKGPQTLILLNPKSLNLTRKSVRQKMDNVTTAKRKDIEKGTHYRLAHINKKRIEKLQHDGLLKSTDDEPFDQCVSCISGKMTRKPFSHKTEKVKDVLGLIHTDVVVHLDMCQRKVLVTSLPLLMIIVVMVMFIYLSINMKYLKHLSQEFKDYLKAYGIVQQLTPPYIPQHNGVSERRNRTLLTMVQSMMSLDTLPLSFWDYALESVARILNVVPTKKVDKTSYELWHRKVPNLSYLKVWGCEAHVKRHTPDKLQQRSVKCILVGYPKETMGYYFYYPPENKIVVERYANFLENDFILQKESGRIVELEDEDILPSENTSEHSIEEESLAPIVSQEEDLTPPYIPQHNGVSERRNRTLLNMVQSMMSLDTLPLSFWDYALDEHSIEEESLAPIVSQEEDVIRIRRSVRTHKAPDRLCLNVEIDPD